MSKYCNNPECPVYRQPQESGNYCYSCGQKLVPEAHSQDNKSKQIQGDGISVSRVMNDSHDTISNNTTIVLQGQSIGDLTLAERKTEYRNFCVQQIKNGIIPPEVRRKLNERAFNLELDDNLRRDIEQQVIKSSMSEEYSLNSIDLENLEIIKQAIADNRINIPQMLPKLEAMFASQESEVLFYYYLLTTCSSASSMVKKYNVKEQDTYWCSFWAYIAFVKNGQRGEAEKILRSMYYWNDQSQSNLHLLQAVDSIMQGDIVSAKKFFSNCSNGSDCSYLLKPLYITVGYIIKSKGERKLSNSDEVNFYISRIFGIKEKTEVAAVPSYRVPIPEPLRQRVESTVKSPVSDAGTKKVTPLPHTSGSSVNSDISQPEFEYQTQTNRSGNVFKWVSAAVVVSCIIAGLYFYYNNRNSTASTPEPAYTAATAENKPKETTENNGRQTDTKQASAATNAVPAKSAIGNSSTPVKEKATPKPSAGSTDSGVRTPESAPKPKADVIAQLTSAANAGDADARYELGMMYYEGNGVTRNYSTAFSLLKPLAEAGYTKAYFTVAEMYHGGRGVQKNREVAEMWYTKSANAGNAQAKRVLMHSF